MLSKVRSSGISRQKDRLRDMKTTAIFPGSFDPLTLGHLNIIEKASRLFGRIIIGVLPNNAKTPLFSADERVKMIAEVVEKFGNVEVKCFDGLLVDFVREEQADCVIRGIRNMTDFDYEVRMSQVNQKMLPSYETVFLITDSIYSCISSTDVWSGVRYGVDLRDFVPPRVNELIREKYKENYK